MLDGTLHPLRVALDNHTPRLIPDRRRKIEAAVAVVVRDGEHGPEVLLIQRAKRRSDPWSGHMACPGGLRDRADSNLLGTAIRETREEIGLDLPGQAAPLGRLSDGTPRGRGRRLGFVIAPFVFELQDDPVLQINDEVQAVVWVPLAYLGDRSNRSSMLWWRGVIPIRLPCFRYQGYLVWGVTLRILDELVTLLP